ncbi:MAG: hypothetical protein KGH71_01965 [Candidatus Micrarchaeota archaeon]|nr:hypothetical protein [Candidatus Micrarchaeota archaeon]
MQRLRLSNPLKTAPEDRYRRLTLDLCNKVLELIDSKKYPDQVIAKTVDSILLGLDDRKDAQFKNEIRKVLVKEIPYIQWSFTPYVEALRKQKS